jgi:hypothetical protein
MLDINEELTEFGLVEVASGGAFGVHGRKSRIRDKREPAKPKIGISLQGGGPKTFRILSDLPSNEDQRQYDPERREDLSDICCVR